MPSLIIKSRDGRSHEMLYDACDEHLATSCKWYASKERHEFYARTNCYDLAVHAKRTFSFHRIIMGLPHGLEVDHINGCGLDNRRVNLRSCLPWQNKANHRRISSNTSGFTGVYKAGCLRDGSLRWKAEIKCRSRKRRLGTFTSKEEAARAYDAAAKELFGDFARLNFPNKESP